MQTTRVQAVVSVAVKPPLSYGAMQLRPMRRVSPMLQNRSRAGIDGSASSECGGGVILVRNGRFDFLFVTSVIVNNCCQHIGPCWL